MSSKLKIDTRVRSLKNYLEEFEQGAFQIPSFQRDFLWSQDDIKQLFDSIKNNYPIGSIQFWRPLENATSWLEESKIGPYRIKTISDKEPIYILDGFQRLSSLFGCLTNPEKYNKTNLELDQFEWRRNFNLFYDLEEEQFIYLRSSSNNQYYQVPVYVFMNSIDFRQYARKNFEKLEDEKKIEIYYDRADEIGQIFTNYQIASVDINFAPIEEAVEIFWRVNAKGVMLSKDWIVSALTLKDDFRLGTEIDKLLEELKVYNFENIKRDIIFQCIQSAFGKIYFDYKIEELVKREDFAIVTKKTFSNIKKAVQFLFEYLLVVNSKLIPYNSQLIFLTIFFNSIGNKEISDKQILSLKKWFWITTYSNYFTIFSLSNQRKSFEQFKAFIEDDEINPVYFDNEKSKFNTGEFPPKIYMGSVRAKALALFLLNYYKGIRQIDLQKIDTNFIESFEMGNLFSKPQKENPSENFIPVLEEIEEEGGSLVLKSLSKTKRPKDYSFLLENVNDNLFINNEMVELNNEMVELNNKNENMILGIRRGLIMKAEQNFVQSLDMDYTGYYDLPF